MDERHLLAPLRRWLIQPGSQKKIITALLISVLVAAAALIALHTDTVTDGTDTVDIEHSRHSTR